MAQLGPSVTTGETSGASGASVSTGTAFVSGLADSGPLGIPTLLRSLSEYIGLFGARTATSAALYDWVSTFFALGGSRLYVLRATSSAAKKGELTLNDSGTKPTLLVTAAYAGTYGNSIKVEVKAKSGEAEVRILNEESELLETTGMLKTQAEIIEWSEKHTTYVTITASQASEHTTNLPKEATSKALTGGANPAPSETEQVESLSDFAISLGPGQLAFANLTGEEAHVALAERAQADNRVAWADLEDQSTTSSLVSEKGTLASGIAPYVAFTSSTVIVQGVVPGTTRTVAGSAVACALCARVAAEGNDNIAPAGVTWPLEPYVQGFTKEWGQPEMEALNAAGINSFAVRNGVLCLYGFVSGLSPTVDEVFWQFTAVRERMRLVMRAKEIGEPFTFSQLDGRRHDISDFQAALQDLVAEEWEKGALFGETAAEAGQVNTGEPINTLQTMQEGKLCAQLRVRIAPFAQAVLINIVISPITETV